MCSPTTKPPLISRKISLSPKTEINNEHIPKIDIIEGSQERERDAVAQLIKTQAAAH